MRYFVVLLLGGIVSAQTGFFPLQDVRPGMQATGRTVFSGDRVEDFQVEILGVLENAGPKQSLILGRLSGGPLGETGVMQGMSGSPVYIDGKLVGAVAMAFAFSKEPIAGIRPIQEMLRVGEPAPPRPPRKVSLGTWDGELAKLLPAPEDVLAGGARLVDIATPVSFGGFTRATVEHFAPQLRALGLEPRQGIAGGGRLAPQLGNPSLVQPGSMISVQLLSGDMSVGADGTVTHVDGTRIYAFGHRFLSIGSTELPFARAEVLTLLPNLSTSFKISTAREWMGALTEDRSTGVAGELGRRAATIPVSIAVRRAGPPAAKSSYDLQLVHDRLLSPFLLQMAVFSAIDATEHAVGGATFAISGEVEFENGAAPLKLHNIYAGDFNLAAQVSLATAAPVAYVMQSGFEALQLKRVVLDIEVFPQKRELQIAQIWSSRREVRPGDSLDLTLVLAGENAAEVTHKVTYQVPLGAPPGALYFTAADANIINVTEFRQMIGSQPKSAAQLLSFINSLRANTNAYVRVWRAQPVYDVQGEALPDPPPSLAMILARSQASLGAPAQANAKVAEFEIGTSGMVVTGSKTIQVEVKE